MQNHNDDTIKTSDTEKYTSHFIWKGSKGLLKVLLCERWVEGWTELQHIDPHSYGHNSVSFPFPWAAQQGAWGPSLSGTWTSFQYLLSNWSELQLQLLNGGAEGPLCWMLVFSTASYLQLTRTSCRWGYIIIWRPLFFLRASIQPLDSQGYILIFIDWMHLLFTQVHFLFWHLGRVGGQYTTIPETK